MEPLDAEDHSKELSFSAGVACFCIRVPLKHKRWVSRLG